MTSSEIAISIDPKVLEHVDSLIRAKRFRSRSELFQAAVTDQLTCLNEDVLARECAKLDPHEEQAFADIGLSTDLREWPAY